jgi:hypothetical protein
MEGNLAKQMKYVLRIYITEVSEQTIGKQLNKGVVI